MPTLENEGMNIQLVPSFRVMNGDTVIVSKSIVDAETESTIHDLARLVDFVCIITGDYSK